jgi:hypothetical protein
MRATSRLLGCVAPAFAVALTMLGTGCGGDAVPVPSVSGPGSTPVQVDHTVFDFGSDDLCQWITVEQMASIVIEAYGSADTEVPLVEPDATAIRQPPNRVGTVGLSQPAGCDWQLADGVWVWAVDGSEVLDDARRMPGGPQRHIGFEPFASHDLLNDQVVWTPSGFGTLSFYVESRDSLLIFSHSGPEGGQSGEDLSQEFTIVNTMLEQMGWIMTDAR